MVAGCVWVGGAGGGLRFFFFWFFLKTEAAFHALVSPVIPAPPVLGGRGGARPEALGGAVVVVACFVVVGVQVEEGEEEVPAGEAAVNSRRRGGIGSALAPPLFTVPCCVAAPFPLALMSHREKSEPVGHSRSTLPHPFDESVPSDVHLVRIVTAQMTVFSGTEKRAFASKLLGGWLCREILLSTR